VCDIGLEPQPRFGGAFLFLYLASIGFRELEREAELVLSGWRELA
jgi:hypothetical protein